MNDSDDITGKRVLVIEDDAEFLDLICDLLDDMGVRTVVARDGREGLRTFDSDPCDAVITDIQMPDVQGNEVVRALRGHDESLPIIAISGGGRARNMEFLGAAGDQGADHIVEKPFDVDEFCGLVRRVLSRGTAPPGR